jgi:hypothetical protein
MTFASGMRVRRSRIPTALEDGGTGSRTREEAVAALGVPSLTADNVFLGENRFGTVNVVRIGRASELALFTVDTLRIEGGAADAVLDLTLLTGDQTYALPDASGTLALTSDITGGSGLSQAQTFARISMGF